MESISPIIIGHGIVGVQVDSLIKGGQRLLVTAKGRKYIAPLEMSESVSRVERNGTLIGGQRLLVAAKQTEHISLVQVGNLAGVQTNGLLEPSRRSTSRRRWPPM